MGVLRKLRSRSESLARDESGAVIVIVAISMVALLGLTALVIDGGGLWERDREIQTVADAGALAGAQELIRSQGDTSAARGLAESYISKNVKREGFLGPTTHVVEGNLTLRDIAVTPSYVEVQLREGKIPFFFAPVIGQTEGSVYARARANVAYVTGLTHMFPVALMYVDPERFRFDYIPDAGGETLSFHVEGERDAGGQRTGNWAGSRTFTSYATGRYRVNLTAIVDGRDEYTWTDVGSWWVAQDAAAPVQRVKATRDVSVPGDWNAQLAESMRLEVRLSETVDVTGVTFLSVRSNAGTNQRIYNDPLVEGGRLFAGTYYFGTPSMSDGYADIDVWINNPGVVGSSHFSIAKFKWFQRGEPLVYAKIGPDESYDAYSGPAAAGGSVSLSGKVVTKTLRFDEETLLKVSQSSAGGYHGSLFWADVYQEASNLGGELDGPAPGDTWTAWGDMSRYGGDGDGVLEVGEVVGDDNGVMPGLWRTRLGAFVGEEIVLPIVGPRSTYTDERGVQRWWPVTSFAAFRIEGWDPGEGPGAPDAKIWGTFLHYQASGSWSFDRPGPLYVETAVLTK